MGIPDRVKQLVYEEADFQCSCCGHQQGLNLSNRSPIHIRHIVFLSPSLHVILSEAKNLIVQLRVTAPANGYRSRI